MQEPGSGGGKQRRGGGKGGSKGRRGAAAAAAQDPAQAAGQDQSKPAEPPTAMDIDSAPSDKVAAAVAPTAPDQPAPASSQPAEGSSAPSAAATRPAPAEGPVSPASGKIHIKALLPAAAEGAAAPPASAAAAAQGSSRIPQGLDAVNWRIKTWYADPDDPEDGQYYTGIVAKFNQDSGTHLLSFDDGEKLEVSLQKEVENPEVEGKPLRFLWPNAAKEAAKARKKERQRQVRGGGDLHPICAINLRKQYQLVNDSSRRSLSGVYPSRFFPQCKW